MKRILSLLMTAALAAAGLTVPLAANAAQQNPACTVTACTTPIYDEFNGDSLNRDTWLIAEKSWGGENGGVVPANVSVSDGTLKLEGHGNYYTGDVEGLNKSLPGGIRTGAAIATREYYASGSYEVVAKVAPVQGACSAIWTFMYEETEAAKINHEIDIEIPTKNRNHDDYSFECARFNTYVTEGLHNSQFEDLPYAVNDGQYHTYRFDWHTGDIHEQKRVDFYVDGILICTSTKNVPTNASRLWLGLWFPCSVDSDGDHICDTGWTGDADFDTTVFEIDSVRITPFLESGDTVQNESVPKQGWAADSFPEDIAAEHYNHIVNGDFSTEGAAWQVNGDASFTDGRAVLTSGSHTDTVKQVIDVLPKMTYTLSADVYSSGTSAQIGVRKLNGCDNVCQTIDQNGQAVVQFTTGAGVHQVEVYAQVERYQHSDSPVFVDNICFMSGTEVPDSHPDPVVPVIPNPDDGTGQPDSGQTLPSADPGTEPPESNPADLIVNGNFDGSDGWDISGSAVIDQAAYLASGSDTDSVSQTVKVEKGTTYTLSCDVASNGADVIIGVRDYNGRYTELSDTMNTSGHEVLTFTTASHISQIDVFAKVLRYQDNREPVRVDNIHLVKGDIPFPGSSTPITPEVPETPNEPDVPEVPDIPDVPDIPEIPVINLLLNGCFDSTQDWKLSGSAAISKGVLQLDSGKDTDTAKQTVKVSPNTTYTLSADLITSGCVVDLKVSDYDGKYSCLSNAYSSSDTGTLTFTTGSGTKEVTITFHVLRYQDTNGAVTVDNAVLYENTAH